MNEPNAADDVGKFVLARDGTLTLPKGNYSASQLKFEFPAATKWAEVRIDSVNANDSTNHRLLACGPLKRKLVQIPAPPAGSVIQLQLYDLPSDPVDHDRVKEMVATAITSTVPKLAPTERDEVRRTMLVPLQQTLQDALVDPTDAKRLSAAGSIATAITADEHVKWCTTSNSPLAPAICSEIRKVEGQLETVHEILVGSGSDVAVNFVKNKLTDAVAALAIPDQMMPGDRDRYCDSVGRLRWLARNIDHTRRLIARAQIPYVARENLVWTKYGRSADDVTDVSRTSPIGFLVLDAPVSIAGSFAAHQGNTVTTDLGSLLLAAIPPVVRSIPTQDFPSGKGVLVAESFAQIKSLETPDFEPLFHRLFFPPEGVGSDDLSLVCNAQPTLKFAVDPTLAPVASIEARGFLFGPIPRKYTTDVVACDGAVCSGTSDDKQVRSRISLTTEQHGRLTLLGELSLGVGLGFLDGNTAHLHGFGFGGQSSPAFAPILGTSGPDQAFELEQTADPRNALTTALLLAIHIPKPQVWLLDRTSPDWILGIGPSLSIGSSGAALSQWNVHFGARLASSVYLTFGPSFRFVPIPTYYKLGDVTAVPLPTMGAATAPSFDTRESVLLQFDVGIAIDIGGAASTAASTISSLGGSK